MQCALHQLGGDGVPDRPSGHRQGHLWDADGRVSTYGHRCALQGVITRHHADRQPEKVSPHLSQWTHHFNRTRLNSPYCSEHQRNITKVGSIKLYRLLKGLTATTEHTVSLCKRLKPAATTDNICSSLLMFGWIAVSDFRLESLKGAALHPFLI